VPPGLQRQASQLRIERMTDLPPGERLAKLRTLEEWLRWQLQDTQRKIAAVEQQVREQAYVVEKAIREGHPLGATVHLADCTMAQRETRQVSADEARFALTKDKGFFTSCEFCAPAASLGVGE
jgi:CHASE3 domain sensor protein